VKLSDIRRLAIKQQLKIHYRLRNGMECIVTEQGIAQVPALKSVPDFNLEEELAVAGEFLLEPAMPLPPRKIGRDELAAMTGDSGTPVAAHEHEDE
jgi:hypothetical protein